MKGYKVFGENWQCRGFQFEIGKTYVYEGKLKLCESGFHFCKKLSDCFNYYSFNSKNKVAEIEFNENNVIHGEDKSVTNKITILKELSWFEVLQFVNIGKNNTGYNNSGDCNSGDCNSGNRNSGYRNSGYWNSGNYNSGDCNSGNRNSGNYNSGDNNSGDCNSGNRNSGYWNSGNFNSCSFSSGFFNSKESPVVMFNKPTNLMRNEIDLSFLCDMRLIEWVNKEKMTEKEKLDNPSFETTGGYLRKYSYKGMWANWYAKQDKSVDDKIKSLPNFDSDIFEEITGLKIK